MKPQRGWLNSFSQQVRATQHYLQTRTHTTTRSTSFWIESDYIRLKHDSTKSIERHIREKLWTPTRTLPSTITEWFAQNPQTQCPFQADSQHCSYFSIRRQHKFLCQRCSTHCADFGGQRGTWRHHNDHSSQTSQWTEAWYSLWTSQWTKLSIRDILKQDGSLGMRPTLSISVGIGTTYPMSRDDVLHVWGYILPE